MSQMFIICFFTGLHLKLLMCRKEHACAFGRQVSFPVLYFKTCLPFSSTSKAPVSAIQLRLKVREIFVDVNDWSGFSNSYARFKVQFNLFVKDL